MAAEGGTMMISQLLRSGRIALSAKGEDVGLARAALALEDDDLVLRSNSQLVIDVLAIVPPSRPAVAAPHSCQARSCTAAGYSRQHRAESVGIWTLRTREYLGTDDIHGRNSALGLFCEPGRFFPLRLIEERDVDAAQDSAFIVLGGGPDIHPRYCSGRRTSFSNLFDRTFPSYLLPFMQEENVVCSSCRVDTL